MTPLHRQLLALSRMAVPGGSFAPELPALLKADERAMGLAGELDGLPAVERLVVMLRTLALDRDAVAAEALELEFVATLPGYSSSVARSTEVAIGELLRSAKHQVVAVGYEFTEATIIAALQDVVRRGAEVVCVTDRRSGHGRMLLETWPAALLPPRVFQEKANDISDMAKMHGKALLVDGEALFLSSANFTWLGMNANIELGVVLKGPRLRPARTLFEELLVHSQLLERVTLEGHASEF